MKKYSEGPPITVKEALRQLKSGKSAKPEFDRRQAIAIWISEVRKKREKSSQPKIVKKQFS